MKNVFASKKKDIIEINSSSNKSFHEWKQLLTGRGIKKSSAAIVSGEKIIREIILNRPEIVISCLFTEKIEFEQFDVPDSTAVYRLDKILFNDLDILGTNKPLLVVKTDVPAPFEPSSFKGQILLMIPFQDPVNVGSVIRTASAFGVKDVMLMEEASTPFHPKSIRASAGEVFNMRFYKGNSVKNIDSLGMPLVILAKDGENIGDFNFPARIALLAGLEGPGLPDNISAEFKISIPIEPHVESLNASVAVSIALYEWKRKMKGKISKKNGSS